MSGHASLYWIHAHSPIRVGTDEGLGAINLPTLREAHTGHPLIPGSSVKGVLRAEIEGSAPDKVRMLFGPDREHAEEHRGTLAFGDAHLIALPVRSLFGTFAWCTSATILRRLNENRQECGLGKLVIPAVGDDILITTRSALSAERRDGNRTLSRVFIEEFSAPAQPHPDVDKVAEALASEVWPGDEEAREFFKRRFAILPENAMNALTRTAMEVRTRVPIESSTGTAAISGPWSEEAMPAETLLAGLVIGRKTRVVPSDQAATAPKPLPVEPAYALDQLDVALKGSVKLRFGGHNTVGMGRGTYRLVRKGGKNGGRP